MKISSSSPAEEAARQNLRRAVAESGISLAKLSLALKKNRAYLAQYLDNASPKKLTFENRIQLARDLGISEMALNPETAEEWSKNPDTPAPVGLYELPALWPRGALEKDGLRILQQPIWSEIDLDSAFPVEMNSGSLPLFGTVAAGADNILVNGVPQGWVDRPSALKSTPGAYAMRVTGDSMFPKFRPGDIIIAAPSKSIHHNSFVVVALNTDSGAVGLIKQFDRIENETLYLTQVRPRLSSENLLQFDIKNVLHIHKVISTIEGS